MTNTVTAEASNGEDPEVFQKIKEEDGGEQMNSLLSVFREKRRIFLGAIL